MSAATPIDLPRSVCLSYGQRIDALNLITAELERRLWDLGRLSGDRRADEERRIRGYVELGAAIAAPDNLEGRDYGFLREFARLEAEVCARLERPAR